MTELDTALLVIALTLGTAIGARRLDTPMPIVLAAVGMLLGAVWRFVPWVQPVIIPPERVLFVFLPPLLMTAAYALPLGAFRRNIVPIALLAIGLVLATMLATAAAAHAFLGLPWAAAFILGAIVSPPDPVAATAVGQQTGLPHRIVITLEGEGLVNDAIAIVAYDLTVRAAVANQFSWSHAALTVLWSAPAGVAIGYVIGRAVAPLRRRLDDVTVEAGISLFLPYLTYEIADRLGASAVLAVVTLGFVLQRQITTASTAASRLASRTVWASLRFASTALVFLLLGFLIGEAAQVVTPHSLLLTGSAVTAAVIVLRFVWIFSVPSLRRWAHVGRVRTPSSKEGLVLSWAGMRGVVSLALALALPALPPDGGGTRRTIIAVTFLVIIVTLVLQGATLLPLVRALGLSDPRRDARDERRARARARRAGLAALDRIVRREPALQPECAAMAELVADGIFGIASRGALGSHGIAREPVAAALHAERQAVMALRDTGQIGESVAERLVTELDVDLMTVRGDAARLTGNSTATDS